MDYKDFEKHINKQYSQDQQAIDVQALLGKLNLPAEAASKSRNIWLAWLLPILGFVTLGTVGVIFYTQDDSGTDSKDSPNTPSFIGDSSTNQQSSSLLENNDASLSSALIETKSSSDAHEEMILNSESLHQNLSSVQSKNIESKQNQSNLKSKNSSQSGIPFDESQQTNNTKFSATNTSKEIKPKVQIEQNSSYLTKDFNNHTSKLVDETLLISPLNDLSIDHEILATPKVVECPDFNKRHLTFHMGIEAGYSKPQKELFAKDAAPDDVFYNRLENEHSLEGVDLHLFGIVGKKNFPVSLKLGANYFRLSERMNYEKYSVTMDTTVGIINTVVSTNGDTITHIYGDIISQIESSKKSKVHYFINQFNIPVSLLYNVDLERLSIQVEGGVNFNVSTWTSGLLLAEHEDFVSLSSLQYFRRNLGLSYFARLNFVKQISIRNSLYLAPQFHYNPQDWTTNINDIGQKYQNWALKAGYIYQF